MAYGSITQRGDKYRVCFDYGVDREGKRVRKYRTFDTKRDAIRAFNEHKVKMDRGRRSCRANTRSRSGLTTGTIILSCHRSSKRRHTVIKHHNLLTNTLNAAERQEYITKNPMRAVSPPKKRQREAKFYTPEQLGVLLAKAVGTRLELPMFICAYLGLRRGELCLEVYPVESVGQLAAHLRGEAPLEPAAAWTPGPEDFACPDFADVKGQENVKRALEIAAAGGHNLCMVGPPGSGKSMLARRLPSILPDMSRSEALEATEIHSVMGLTDPDHPLISRRPFRSPHHTISPMGLAGGGTNPRPGEISLAHHGVLFLDELPEFSKEVLEVLRQPLEDGQVQISRAAGSVTYPSRFMLVCAMNPCKCGWYGHPSGRCRCTEQEVRRYLSRLSGPLLDRIDLFVEVAALEFGELARRAPSEPSSVIKGRVDRARDIQRGRYGDASCNARMGQQELDRFCALDSECQRLMQGAFDRMGLTARSYDRILRVARTIADLDSSTSIQLPHLAEALQYRPPEYLRR